MKQLPRENQIFKISKKGGEELEKIRPYLNIKCEKSGNKWELDALFITTGERKSLCKQYWLRKWKDDCLIKNKSYVNIIDDFVILSLSAKPSLDKKIVLCGHSPCLDQKVFAKILRLYNSWQKISPLDPLFLKEKELKFIKRN
jgi:hypothetical protein